MFGQKLGVGGVGGVGVDFVSYFCLQIRRFYIQDWRVAVESADNGKKRMGWLMGDGVVDG